MYQWHNNSNVLASAYILFNSGGLSIHIVNDIQAPMQSVLLWACSPCSSVSSLQVLRLTCKTLIFWAFYRTCIALRPALYLKKTWIWIIIYVYLVDLRPACLYFVLILLICLFFVCLVGPEGLILDMTVLRISTCDMADLCVRT